MSNNEIENKIKETMSAVFNIDINQIDINSTPDTLKGWDSVGHMNLILALEEEFNIQFSDEQTSELLSLKLITFHIGEILKNG